MALWNIQMQSRPGADEDGSEAAPENGPSPAAIWLRSPAVDKGLIFGLDVRNPKCNNDPGSEWRHDFAD